jgi:hypothetical protein
VDTVTIAKTTAHFLSLFMVCNRLYRSDSAGHQELIAGFPSPDWLKSRVTSNLNGFNIG